MINIIAWSKNRAAQLDLTLSSYKKYFKDWKECKLTIIYTYSNDYFKEGYDLVISYHPEFNWIKETNFRNDTINALNTNEKLTAFIVDDDIFVSEFSLFDPEVIEFLKNDTITCISPRIAPYVNYCYTQNQPQPAPVINEKGIWNWINGIHDWGYPSSIAAFHIFRTSDILFIKNLNFRAPNSLEGEFNNYYPRNRPNMISFKNQKAITGTSNRVQVENMNRADNSHSVEDLNREFIIGKRLSTDTNHNVRLNACHGPLELQFI